MYNTAVYNNEKTYLFDAIDRRLSWPKSNETRGDEIPSTTLSGSGTTKTTATTTGREHNVGSGDFFIYLFLVQHVQNRTAGFYERLYSTIYVHIICTHTHP